MADIHDSLDWERILSGQRRALDPAHQSVFDAVAERDALLQLLRDVMAERVEYNTGSYALVQMGHRLRGEIRAALAAKDG